MSQTPQKILVAVAWPYATGRSTSDTWPAACRRHLRALSAAQGQRRADGLRDRRARDAGHGRAEKEGVTPGRSSTATTSSSSRPAAPRDLATTSSRDDDPEPLRRQQDMFRRCRERLSLQHRMLGIRRGRAASCPTATSRAPAPLRLRRGARRPVRQVRRPLDATELIDPRSSMWAHAGAPRDRALLPGPARVQRAACRSGSTEGALAAERQQLHPRDAGERRAARHHPRHRLGHTGTRSRATEEQAHLRLVRRRHRLPLRGAWSGRQLVAASGGLARLVAGSGCRHYYFMGKDNIVFHTVIWPGMLMGYGGAALRPALRRGRQRVSDDAGAARPPRAATGRRSARLPRALRRRRAALQPHHQRAGDADTDFTWEEYVRRNNDELVAT